MPAKWKGDNKSIAKVREECARHMRVQEYFFLMHFRVGGSAALALFVPLHALLFLLLLIWYLKIVAPSQPHLPDASKVVNGSLSFPVKSSKRAELFSLCFLFKKHLFPKYCCGLMSNIIVFLFFFSMSLETDFDIMSINNQE